MGYKWAEYTLVIMGVVGGALFFLSVALRGGHGGEEGVGGGEKGERGGGQRNDTHTGVRLWQAAKAFIITAALLGEAREVGEGGGRAENEGVEL